MRFRRFVVCRSLFLVASPFLAVSLAGCGIGDGPSNLVSLGSIDGVVHGGSNPIASGNVILWETQSNGYGGNAKQLATATTGTNGGFSIDNVNHPYTCDAGQYAYLTVTGGYTGSNLPNPNSIQMAAMGSCAHLASISAQSATHIAISELSTVAAAYSLGRFITVNASGATGHQLINVSAPAANNAASPACTGSGAALSCSASGLGHAFANAANLVNAVSFSGSIPNGQAYTVSPSNNQGSVPQALINAIGNILQSCVNTDGGSAGDGSACGKLFSYTTSPTLTPEDTLEAAMNMAQNPSSNVSRIFGLSTPIAAFNPTLNSMPADFSLAIAYSGTYLGGTATAFKYPNSLSLDAADNVYVLSSDASAATYSALAGLGSDGTSLFFSSHNAAYTAPAMLATDTLGHAWATNNGTPATLVGFSTADGSVALTETTTAMPFGIAVDKANNLWFTTTQANVTDLFELQQASAYSSASFANPPSQTLPPYNVSIDAQQNVWVADYTIQGITGAAAIFSNTGTVSAPAYGNAFLNTLLPTGYDHAFGVAIDASGSGWIASEVGLTKLTPALTSGVVTGLASTSAPTPLGSDPRVSEVDGAGTLWSADAGSGGYLYFYQPSLGVSSQIKPCYAPLAAQTCGSSSLYSLSAQIDSAGSLWVAAPGSSMVLQVIGSAAPTWPQLSYGQPGVMPQ